MFYKDRYRYSVLCDVVGKTSWFGQIFQHYEHTDLDIREICFERVGTRVAGVEEHELCFLQMTGRQALLRVHMMTVKEITQANSPSTHAHTLLPVISIRKIKSKGYSPSRQVEISSINPSPSSHSSISPHPSLPVSASVA